ncbi:ABC transporter substrate-binding protein [soil metagenome]
MAKDIDLINAFVSGSVNRREFVSRAMAIGLSIPIVNSLVGMPTASAAPAHTSSRFSAANQEGGGTLVFGAWQTPDTMDPQKTGLAATGRILANCFDPLVWRFPGDDNFYPGLASTWEISEDSLEYTFHLRTDVKFHNGEAFNAAAVKYTFDRLNDPANGTLETVPRGFNRVEVIDDATAKIVFDAPYAPFLILLSAGNWRTLPPVYAAENVEGMSLTPPGTGPFMITDYVAGSYVTIVRNPDYNWAPEAYFGRQGPALLDGIDWRIIAEAGTRASTLESGETNLIEEIPPAQFESLSGNSSVTIYEQATLGCPRSIQLNCTKAPTDDKLVRQAINYAVDKTIITDVIFKKTVQPAWGPLEKLTPGYEPQVETLYAFDPEKAKALLDEAGWVLDGDTRSKDGVELTANFIVIANDNMDEAAQVVQSQLKDIGINLELSSEAEPTVFNTYNRGEQNLANIFWWGADPESLYSLYHSSQIAQGFNWSHYTNAEVDALLEEGYLVSDFDARMALYKQAQLLIMEDAPLLPLWGKMSSMAGQTTVTGWDFTLNVYPLHYNTTLG